MTRYAELGALVQKWRSLGNANTYTEFHSGQASSWLRCADELEAALAILENSKVVNSELYGLAIPLADHRAARVFFEICPIVYENGKWWYDVDRLSKDSLIRLNFMPALRYLELREASGEPMPYKVVRDGDKVRFE